MTYTEILDSLRAKLTGADYAENSAILREEGIKFGKEGNYDGVRAVGEIMLEIMPDSEKKEVEHLTHLDGVRLDEYYNNIVKMINDKNAVEAKPLAEKLYNKIIQEYSEGETAKFVSLRNPFEDNLYQHLFKNEKTLNRAPFDFATYITVYAYLLVETGSPLDAIPVLEKAIEYNPVDCGPKFELAEVYKVLKNKAKVIEITKDTLKIASSPVAIARCYANMGYMCTDIGELDDAVAFYTASVMMAPHPAIPYELRGLAQMKGEDIKKPSFDEIKTVFAKYDMDFGPDKEVISVAAQLSSHFLTAQDIPNAVNSLKVLYNLTLDEDVKKMILKYDPNAQQVMNGAPSQNQERPEITRTVNENPEA